MKLNYVLIKEGGIIGHVLQADVSEDYKMNQSLQGIEYREIPGALLPDADHLTLDGTGIKVDQVRRDKKQQKQAIFDRLSVLDLSLPLGGKQEQALRDLIRLYLGKA